MGWPADVAQTAVRFTLGAGTTAAEATEAAASVRAAVAAVASLGVRPTVDDSGRVLLEVHLFDFAGSCYGKLVRVEFLEKIRDEEKYDDLPTLIAAIEGDAAHARGYFSRRPAALTATDRI